MLSDVLPDIPRVWTAGAEWLACSLAIGLMWQRKRLPAAHTIAAMALSLPVFIGLHVYLGTLPVTLWVLGMSSAVALMAIMLICLARISAGELWYHTARSFVFAELIASLHWQLSTYFSPQEATDTPLTVLLGIAVYGFSALIVWLIETRWYSNDVPTEVTASDARAAVAIALLTFAVSNLSFVTVQTPFSGRLGPEIFYIRTLVDLCGFFALYAQQERIREVRAAMELASIEATLHSQHQHYLQSKANIEAAGRTYHDLRHHIDVLRNELDPGRAHRHFEELEESIASIGQQQHTGNPVLDVVLTSKVTQASEHGIILSSVADGSLLSPMAAMDIATLFGNALDNAIEAARQVPETSERLINFALFSRGNMTVIRVENVFARPLLTDESGDLLTTKLDSTKHGIGVKSIRYTAAKYHGEVNVEAADGWFTLTILFPQGIRPLHQGYA